jgi:hypothetical protein
MLQRPGEQEFLQLLPPWAIDCPPAQVGDDLPQMIGAGLLSCAIAAKPADRDPQPLGQARDRGRGDTE